MSCYIRVWRETYVVQVISGQLLVEFQSEVEVGIHQMAHIIVPAAKCRNQAGDSCDQRQNLHVDCNMPDLFSLD